MGVLGWTPKVLMQEACLHDLQDAFTGYAEHHGLLAAPPVSRKFLNDMMAKFPDGRNK